MVGEKGGIIMVIMWGAMSIAMLVIGFLLGPDDKEVVNQIEAMINCLGMLLATVGAYYFFVMTMQCILDYMRCSSEVPDYCKIIKK